MGGPGAGARVLAAAGEVAAGEARHKRVPLQATPQCLPLPREAPPARQAWQPAGAHTPTIPRPPALSLPEPLRPLKTSHPLTPPPSPPPGFAKDAGGFLTSSPYPRLWAQPDPFSPAQPSHAPVPERHAPLFTAELHARLAEV